MGEQMEGSQPVSLERLVSSRYRITCIVACNLVIVFSAPSDGFDLVNPGNSRSLSDIVIAVIIVAVAAVLGFVVHPILWVLMILAVLWFPGRRRTQVRLEEIGPRLIQR
jgi:hypothetical protein